MVALQSPGTDRHKCISGSENGISVDEAPLFTREERESSAIVPRCLRAHFVTPKILRKMLFDTKWLRACSNPRSAIEIDDEVTANLAAFASAFCTRRCGAT
jgi:hypothetical protein